MKARHCAVSGLLAIVGVVGGCGLGAKEITENTKCSDYLDFPTGERHTAAMKVAASLGRGGNPMWGLSLDGTCAQLGDRKTIGQYFTGE